MPDEAGGSHDTVAEVLPAIAVTFVGAPGVVDVVRDPAAMNTFESYASSPTSPIASFIVLVWLGVTVAVQISTVVSPSISVSIGAPLAMSLLRNRLEFVFWLIVSIDTGEESTVAQFWPFTKKPKTSLKPCPTNSLYSSEEKT